MSCIDKEYQEKIKPNNYIGKLLIIILLPALGFLLGRATHPTVGLDMKYLRHENNVIKSNISSINIKLDDAIFDLNSCTNAYNKLRKDYEECLVK